MRKIIIIVLCLSLLYIPMPSFAADSQAEKNIWKIFQTHAGKMDMAETLMALAFFIWELPQNLAGAAVLTTAHWSEKIEKIEFEKDRIFIKTDDLNVSLGSFVFWQTGYEQKHKNHEFGHSLQSRILGPLYLLVAGIPSFCRLQYYRCYLNAQNNLGSLGYYQGFPENWANRLGGVNPKLKNNTDKH